VEYLGLFAIVLTHEFGHALACKQVGGQANQIVLWPLGGVAYVSPPQRPGAMLWSIAAGPLVNVALVPVFSAFWLCGHFLGWSDSHPDAALFLVTIWEINLLLLILNMLPVYPLDGGQILRSLLWYAFGRANSLMIASVIGFLGVAAAGVFVIISFVAGDSASALWLGFLDLFIAMNCWNGFRQAQALSRLEKMPRRPGFACPVCHASPPLGEFWLCSRCRKPFDTFLTRAFCPHCNAEYNVTSCPDCGSARPLSEWTGAPSPAEPPML
jgi:Zn-dependent protease